jgi:site-specific recombinase XerD
VARHRPAFTTEFGGPVDPRNLLRVVEAASETAGTERVGVHTLRHSVAVGWLESGVRITAVANLLGSLFTIEAVPKFQAARRTHIAQCR